MTEEQFISKIKELRNVKPSSNWVFLTKEKILGKESKQFEMDRGLTSISFRELMIGIRFVLGHKLAFVSLAIFVVLVGTFGFIERSLPGDSLYSLKKFTEQSQAIFTPQGEESKRSLELANRRLDDLTKIAQNNSVKNLAPAINEYKATVSEAAKKLTIGVQDKNLDKIKEIVSEVKKLEENRQKVEALGVVIDDGTSELNNALAQLVEREIGELEKRDLSGKEQEIMEVMKQDYEKGEYCQALEKILFLSNNEE